MLSKVAMSIIHSILEYFLEYTCALYSLSLYRALERYCFLSTGAQKYPSCTCMPQM